MKKPMQETRKEYNRIADAIASTKNPVEVYVRDSWVEGKFHTVMRLCFELGRLYQQLSAEDWSEE